MAFSRKKSLKYYGMILLPPENIEGLEVTKLNKEFWRKIAHETKTFDIRFQHLQGLILKSMTVVSYMGNNFLKTALNENRLKSKKILKFYYKNVVPTRLCYWGRQI